MRFLLGDGPAHTTQTPAAFRLECRGPSTSSLAERGTRRTSSSVPARTLIGLIRPDLVAPDLDELSESNVSCNRMRTRRV